MRGAAGLMGERRVVVAIPARDEVERITPCLEAIAAQRGAGCDAVVVLANNCTDGTPDAVRALAPALPFAVHVAERDWRPAVAHAGTARSAAMAIAAELAGPDGLLLTTDADGEADPDWIRHTLAAIDRGAAAVCGRAVLLAREAGLIPAHLHADDVAECRYATLLDEIHHRLDPDPADPWPRHTEHSGASIATTVAAWQLAGGVPATPAGEDRAFLRALRWVDAPIRHAPDVVVAVSARAIGRARGGMAETIGRRMIRQDPHVDASLEPPAIAALRAELRAALRPLHADRERRGLAAFAARAGLPADAVAAHLRLPFFGAAWDAVEAMSPLLAPAPVLRADLAARIAEAESVLRPLRETAAGALAV